MADSNLSELPSELLRSALRDTVEKKLKSKKYKIKVTSASQAGANNFMGTVHRVSFSKENENESDKNPVHKIIVKEAPMHLARREQFFSRPSFLREIFMYEKVLPYFRQFEQSKGVIAEEDGFIEYPECYGFVDVDINEGIFLEDLSVRGFSMIEKSTEVVTADHVMIVMRTLAKFHAISFGLSDQHPEKFKELTSNLSEILIRKDSPMLNPYCKMMALSILDHLSSDEDALVRSKIQKLLDERDALDIVADCIDSEAAGQGSVISHGDTWQNNTLFRYDANGKPIDISLLDWQVSRHSSPIIDIVYFVFCCTTKELRDAHYDEFLNIYHESLSSHIRKLGSDPEQLFPFDLMMEHFRKFGQFGLIFASMLLPMITAEASNQGVNMDEISDRRSNENPETIDINDNPFLSENSKNKLHKRLRDVAVDMARLGYI